MMAIDEGKPLPDEIPVQDVQCPGCHGRHAWVFKHQTKPVAGFEYKAQCTETATIVTRRANFNRQARHGLVSLTKLGNAVIT